MLNTMTMQDLGRSLVMIESLIQDRGLKAVKVAGTHGGEWACP